MSIGIMGQKCGMTRIFTEDGVSIPVTVIEVEPNRVSQLKTLENDGYRSVQMVAGSKKTSKLSKAEQGHLAKAGVEAGSLVKECRLNDDELANIKIGDALSVELFNEGQMVDVRGVSRGKGFQGGVKRHNFSMQDATHGNSLAHRAPGSIGQCQTPGRVFKGKKMAGHMGNAKCTVKAQELVKIDIERNLLFVKGAVPGAPGGMVEVITHEQQVEKE